MREARCTSVDDRKPVLSHGPPRPYLWGSVYRAAATSPASEHASPLASMQAAEGKIEEHLEEQRGEFRCLLQATATEEMLDIVTGFEESRNVPTGGPGLIRRDEAGARAVVGPALRASAPPARGRGRGSSS